MGKFKKMRAVTSPNNLVKQDMKISKAWEKQFSPVFALKIASEILTFPVFLPLKWRMVATFSKTSAVSSKKEVV